MRLFTHLPGPAALSAVFAVGLLALPQVTAADAPRGSGPADTVFRNGFVYTVDAVRSRAKALAIKDRKFIAVGTNDDETGTIEPGKSADFIVINQNLLKVPVTDIHKTKVLRTVLGGETVYERK